MSSHFPYITRKLGSFVFVPHKLMKKVEYRRAGIGFWIKDQLDNPFFVIYEYIDGHFDPSPGCAERMSEFIDINYNVVYLLELESVTGEVKCSYKVDQLAAICMPEEINMMAMAKDWSQLNPLLLRFLARGRNLFSICLSGFPKASTSS